MTFYAVSGDIDPETGKSLGGGRDRQWYATQLSTFDPKIGKARMRSVPMKLIPVEVNTFPTLMSRSTHSIRHPDYILIDTEGYDWKVLSTINLEEYRPFLLIYEHNKLGPDTRKALDYMKQGGYKCAFQDHQNTVCWRPCTAVERTQLKPNNFAKQLVDKMTPSVT